jgi:hypothetical protein
VTQAEIAVLLALAHGHDPRQSVDDVRVQAWHSLITQEAPDMPLTWAQERVNRHYASQTAMLMPAHLVASWRTERARLTDRAAIPSGAGTPMPDWFREQIRRINR